ncbi:hypothetical protein [Primorskyibacter sp. S87]|uniref:hypothetical protein n=1 Tax=Primorskyibacter sp. S87 TaxID=3415126 RepID=UPI003C7C8182
MNTSLKEILKAHAGRDLESVTAMSSKRDPYRRDTTANRRDAQWVADVMAQHVTQTAIHPRGLHYVLVTVQPIKPNGKPYLNTEADWEWLSGNALVNARWLGAVSFDSIVDERNSPPVIRVPLGFDIQIEAMPEVEIPDADDLEPRVVVYTEKSGDAGFWWQAQPYTLIIAGEKTSLEPVIDPVATECNAGIFLPTGEMSDTMIWQMVQMIEQCGRPAVLFYLSDFDPSGFSMPKNVARKLQAMADLGHLTQPVTVHDVALTFEQCEALDLPSTPIKATDKRAAKWTAATGRQQTEIDALATLRPRELRKILRDAIAPYWDAGLKDRIIEAVGRYEVTQTERLADQIGPDQMQSIRDAIAEKLPEAQAALDEIRRLTAIDPTGFDLDPLVLPEPKLVGLPSRSPLLDPADDWLTQTEKLVARKKYEV